MSEESELDLELGKTYEISFKGRTTEVVLLAFKHANEDVMWSTSAKEAVLLKLPTGRNISRHPNALRPLKDQLDLFTDRQPYDAFTETDAE